MRHIDLVLRGKKFTGQVQWRAISRGAVHDPLGVFARSVNHVFKGFVGRLIESDGNDGRAADHAHRFKIFQRVIFGLEQVGAGRMGG